MVNLKKGELEVLYHVIKGTEGKCTLSEGRKRDALMRSAVAHLQIFETDRKAIYEKYCMKNEDGTPDVSDGQYHFDKEIAADLKSDIEALYAEEVSIEVPEGIKEILERTEYKPKVGEAEIIDGIFAKL